jgi:hypothetical protein
LKATLPLVEAAMSQRGVPRDSRDDIRQECVLKLLKGIPHFNVQRGSTFVFFWTVICNTIMTHRRRIAANTGISLTSDDSESSEIPLAEMSHSPENQYIIGTLATAILAAFDQDFRNLDQPHHKKAVQTLKKAIQSGDFFFDRAKIIKKLRKTGMRRSDIQYYVDYIMVMARRHLLAARDSIRSMSSTESKLYNTPFHKGHTPEEM